MSLEKIYTVWTVINKNTKEIDAVIATRILEYPRSKAFAIEFVGGSNMRNWIDEALDVFEKTAIFNKCSTLEGYGRRAWTKYLNKREFKEKYRTFEKRI
tara:strand:- start:1447 stop:1743 length:297 start_codon:yes stop_codon:yes gene_type:complete